LFSTRFIHNYSNPVMENTPKAPPAPPAPPAEQKAPKGPKTRKFEFQKSGVPYKLGYGQGDIADFPNPSVNDKLLARLQRDGVVIPYVEPVTDDEDEE
jgi:hypothetical protein